MGDVMNNLTSLSWWGSVVLVGLLVNFLSQFLYPRLAALPTKGMGILRQRTRARQDQFEQRVRLLKEAPDRLMLAIAAEHRFYWIASFVLASAIFSLLLIAILPTLQATIPPWLRVVFFFLSAVLFLGGTRIADRGIEMGRVIVAATSHG